MFMFLPFLLALICACAALRGNGRLAIGLWCALIVITLASFGYHATDALDLHF